jgi:deoxyribodipyrimidine photo-lyase
MLLTGTAVRLAMLPAQFAPWMAAGCLSARTVYHEVKKYESSQVANKSTYWVIFELIWRDFFR